MIVAASFAAGLMYAGEKKKRLDALRSLAGALELVRAELENRVSPVPELCLLLSKRARGQAGDFFAALYPKLGRLGETELAELWTETAEDCLKILPRPELSDFSDLGGIIGAYGLEEQLSALRACEAGLRAAAREAAAAYPDQRRLGLGMGASLGAMLALVLL